MASNLLSRILPAASARSIYEDFRAENEDFLMSDVEERAGLAIDEENLGHGFRDYELEHAEVLDDAESPSTTEDAAFLQERTSPRFLIGTAASHASKRTRERKKILSRSPRLVEDDGEDDVPASLLIEGDNGEAVSPELNDADDGRRLPRTIPKADPRTRETEISNRLHWSIAQAQQRMHGSDRVEASVLSRKNRTSLSTSPRDRALWTWLNATNLDIFMEDVYEYYVRKGIWCMLLEESFNLLIVVFVAVFSTFLTQCIDYSKIPQSKRMDDILVHQCTQNTSGITNVLIWLLSLWLFLRIISICMNIPRLWEMHNFFLHLLDVPDSDMQTVSWQDIVSRIMALRDANPLTAATSASMRRRLLGSQSKERLDALDIANRLMRRENYMIALINKDILDLTLPLPFLRNHQIFSRTIEWNLKYCIYDLMFTPSGQIRQTVLKDVQRRELSNALRNRFFFAGFMNVMCAPFLVLYLLVIYFFKYFNEYQKNPSALGSRQYTPLANWKFREFNELPHLFDERINMSYPFASRYIEQFPKVKTVTAARFVAFISSAIVSVLALASILDPELFLNFEVTSNRTVIFYLGVFGAIWAAARGAIPDDNHVFNPEYALRNVIDYTHYMPAQWKDHLHSDEVKKQFAELYRVKPLIFAEEILSILLAPILLWWSLPQSCDRVVDFFREFTIHVDGLGYVCSFAVFDFKKGVSDNAARGPNNPSDGLRDEYYSTKHGKMAASFYGFIDNYVTNPKTGIPGHVPPGLRHQFHPPPSFPGLTSPTLAAEMQGHRLGRSRSHLSRGQGHTARKPYTVPVGGQASPIGSMLLDPHHRPTAAAIGSRSLHTNRISRSRFVQNPDIQEDEESGAPPQTITADISVANDSRDDMMSGLDESRWETSPTRTMYRPPDEEREPIGDKGAGVLGMLYQFQAQTGVKGAGAHIL